jgi:phosphoglycolate phosphatase
MSCLVVFDLDGTLIDSRRDLADSTNEVVQSYGAEPLPVDRIVSMVGEGARVLIERALDAAGLDVSGADALDRFRLAYNQRLVAHTLPYDGIPSLIESIAARARLAVLSNKPEAPTTELLEAFQLHQYFRWVIGGDSSFPRKPDPSALRYVMSQAQVTKAETLFVGDSMIDVQTARNAEVRMCAALYGFGHTRGDLQLDDRDLRAGDPEALGDVLDGWLASHTLDS